MPQPNDRSNKPLKLAERDVTRTVKDYLLLRGWSPVRIMGGPYSVSGMPDYLMIRYRNPCQVFWLELKASHRGRLGPKQKAWIEAERRKGATVVVCGDVDAFISWYEGRFGQEGQLRLGVGAP